MGGSFELGLPAIYPRREEIVFSHCCNISRFFRWKRHIVHALEACSHGPLYRAAAVLIFRARTGTAAAHAMLRGKEGGRGGGETRRFIGEGTRAFFAKMGDLGDLEKNAHCMRFVLVLRAGRVFAPDQRRVCVLVGGVKGRRKRWRASGHDEIFCLHLRGVRYTQYVTRETYLGEGERDLPREDHGICRPIL